MSKILRIYQFGGPEQFKVEDVEVGKPGAGEVRVRHTAVGLNFIDVYHRTGAFPVPLPACVGNEAAGIVEEVGEGVQELAVGDRVAYTGELGAYCQIRLSKADRLVKIPDSVGDEAAAAVFSKGLTAEAILRRAYKLNNGETILLHAAAGGMGLIMSQWAHHIGATVIGTVSSPEKAELAKANGCTHVIDYSREDWKKRTLDLTDGKGVDVAYDSVGKDTLLGSIDVTRPRGIVVSFGTSSGPVPLVDPAAMMKRGSVFLTKVSVVHYTAAREELVGAARSLFETIEAGGINVQINQRYPLTAAAQAHTDLEARRTTGSTVFIP